MTGTLKTSGTDNIFAQAIAGKGGVNAEGNQIGTNGLLAKAEAAKFTDVTLDVTGEAFQVTAVADGASGTEESNGGNLASGIAQDGGSVTYTVDGEMAVKAFAIADYIASTASLADAEAIMLKDGTTTITAESLRAEAGAMADGGGDSSAIGLGLSGHELTIQAKEDISFVGMSDVAQLDDAVSRGAGSGIGLDAEKSTIEITAGGAVNFTGGQSNTAAPDAEAYGAKLDNSELTIKADGGIHFSAANVVSDDEIGGPDAVAYSDDEDGAESGDDSHIEEAALKAENSKVTLDAGDEKVTFNGDAMLLDGSTMTLKNSADVKAALADKMDGSSQGNLVLEKSTLILLEKAKDVTANGVLGMGDGKIYFYDENDLDEKYLDVENHPEYTQDHFRTIQVNGEDGGTGMVVQGENNELFVRTNSVGGDIGDRIEVANALEGNTDPSVLVTVFDEGMKTGYEGKKDGKGWIESGSDDEDDTFDGKALDHTVTIISSSGINDLDAAGKTLSYDNGVWAYDYDVDVHVDDDSKNVVFSHVATKKAEASTAQKVAGDANTASAAAAISLFGADETLHERLGDLRAVKEDTDAEHGLWAKYIGGRLSTDGLSRDVKVKYNGAQVGYDHYVGNNWTLGVAGEYVDGDTTLTAGSGHVKTRAGALYGTWLGDKGHHLDIIAKVGKVDSDTTTVGGTILHKMDGDFDATAYSLAVEYGRKYDLQDGWFVTPAARLSYVHMNSADYDVKALNNTMHVTNGSLDSFLLRAGARVGKKLGHGSLYFKLAALYDFDGDVTTTLTADGRTNKYESDLGGFGLEYGLGFDHSFGSASLYLDVERISGGDLDKEWGVNVGFRYQF